MKSIKETQHTVCPNCWGYQEYDEQLAECQICGSEN
jgi:ribosomal protein L37E